jgi:hypothetical protein
VLPAQLRAWDQHDLDLTGEVRRGTHPKQLLHGTATGEDDVRANNCCLAAAAHEPSQRGARQRHKSGEESQRP